MKSLKYLASALLLCSIIGCQEEILESGSGSKTQQMSFIASIERPDSILTKTSMDGTSSSSVRNILWSPNDSICVSSGTAPHLFINTLAESSSIAQFDGECEVSGTYSALFPYKGVTSCSSTSYSINLPEVQDYYPDGVAPSAYPMVARFENGKFDFKNLCGILVLKLTGTQTISSITFEGKDSSGNPIGVSGAGTVSLSYSDVPELVIGQTVSSVRLNCLNEGRGVTLNESEATSFHIVLPVGIYSSFTINITTEDGEWMIIEGEKPMEIVRSRRTTTKAVRFEKTVREMVDLGLSVKWASCNIGASKPEEYGLYYQWGDTQGYGSDTSDGKYFDYKDSNGNITYKWCNGSQTTLTKYNTKSDYGTIDNKTVLEMEDDAARVVLGGSWRMPTDEEWTELRNTDNCSWTWTAINGVNGYKVQSLKSGYTDNWIFLPAAGIRLLDRINTVGSHGSYWSSSLNPSYPYFALNIYFKSDSILGYNNFRYLGQSVRPVFCDVTGISINMVSTTIEVGSDVTLIATVTSTSGSTNHQVEWSSSDTSVATVDDSGKVTAVSLGNAVITARTVTGGFSATCNVTVTPETVDLGLSTGVKWANCNLGATSPEEVGNYYAWGETNTKSSFTWSNYSLGSGSSTLLKYCTDSSHGTVDGKLTLESSDDAASSSFSCLRIPTTSDWETLVNECSWKWVDGSTSQYYSGCAVAGYVVSGGGNSIFLPVTGYKPTTLENMGFYWTSSLVPTGCMNAYCYMLSNINANKVGFGRDYGLAIRPVKD